MRTFTIALIAGVHEQGDVRDWCDALFGHWPKGMPPPRIEPVDPELLLGPETAALTWDAAVLNRRHFDSDTLFCRVVDELQQAMVPLLLLTDEPLERLERFHPGAVIAQAERSDPQATAAMLFALAARQTAVRGIDQSLRLAQSFHGETAAEIDRLHTELLLAARVQRDFLPKQMPEVAGLGASVLFRPQGFVSGDTYDVYRLDDRHVGFFLADAMGHGVPAALMTLYISGSLPRKDAQAGADRIVQPAEALTRLNSELHESLAGPARFATAVCGVIDIERRIATLACAGHPPPLRIGPHGIRPAEVSGMLMGVVADYEYEQVTVHLDEGELLVVHSDGIETAFNPKHQREASTPALAMPPHYMHLAGMRRGRALEGLEAAMEVLAADLDSQVGSFHQDDDVTVLAFELSRVTSETGERRSQSGELLTGQSLEQRES